MKIFKHLIWVGKMIIVSLFCKHKQSSDSSCPYTGKTYTTCIKCLKRLSEKRNDS
jgi:hypothetical protein